MNAVLIPTGLSLREMIYEFRHQTLALFKCLLLQRKVCLVTLVTYGRLCKADGSTRCSSSDPNARDYA